MVRAWFALMLAFLPSACAPKASGGLVLGAGSVGTVPSLYFAVTGDTRPATVDDTEGYPATVIDTIFSDIAALSPQPAFVVGTGDYAFASPYGAEAAPQLGIYLQARSRFSGPFFPAMGNHECTGYTDSNCGVGNHDGVPVTYQSYLDLMLAPIEEPLPYYVIHVDGLGGTWTSKLVFVAGNAWGAAQESWLRAVLAENTTYTFVIRHEPPEADTAPGTAPSEAILASAPVTLEICGHTHSYSHDGNRVVVGNGGAPLAGDKDFGFVVVKQRTDGAIVVDAIDYQTGQLDPGFHFVVTAAGHVTE